MSNITNLVEKSLKARLVYKLDFTERSQNAPKNSNLTFPEDFRFPPLIKSRHNNCHVISYYITGFHITK